jgi:3',5'-cyclic AMP phosphodiesterase CpdA
VTLKIATVSDLHVDFPENREALVKIAGEIHRQGAELLIVAGDVSHLDDRIERTLRAVHEAVPRVAYIPGNHDLWSSLPNPAERPEVDTWDRYRIELKAICEKAGAHYLPSAPLVIGSAAIVGTCGWYDYSFAEPWVRDQIGTEVIATKKFGQMAWSDGYLVAFRRPDRSVMPDPEVARIMEDELAAQLAALDARDDIRDVVVVTHHQPFREVVFRTGTLPWEFFCSFMGSERMGELIRKGRKVRAVVYGHSHIVGECQIGGLRVYGTALGYPRERRGIDEAGLLKTRIGWITL